MKGLGIIPILYIKKTLAKFAIVIIARFIFKLTKKILLNKSINYPKMSQTYTKIGQTYNKTKKKSPYWGCLFPY